MAGEITVNLRTLRSIKTKYFSPEGATKANDFLCSSILAVFLTHNFHIKTIFINKELIVKKSSASASIYLLASILYCNLFWEEIATCFLAKITCIVFSGLCITSDDRRGAL